MDGHLLLLICSLRGSLTLLHVFPDWCNPWGLRHRSQWPWELMRRDGGRDVILFLASTLKFCRGLFNCSLMDRNSCTRTQKAHCPQGHMLFCSVDLWTILVLLLLPFPPLRIQLFHRQTKVMRPLRVVFLIWAVKLKGVPCFSQINFETAPKDTFTSNASLLTVT